MRARFLVLILPALSVSPAWPLHAQDLATTCHATSTYDLTLQPGELQFDRAAPAPMRVTMSGSSLRVDGTEVRLATAGRDRLVAFEQGVRALVPRVRAVAEHGVDLATQSVRAEADRLGLSAATRAELDQRLATDAAGLKRRIAASQSTKEWHGEVFDQYVSGLGTELLPLVTADLGQQAMQAALSGDAQAALSLRDTAVGLSSGLQSRLHEQMQALRPEIAALCPSVQRLAELQQGLTGPRGEPLQLLEITPR